MKRFITSVFFLFFSILSAQPLLAVKPALKLNECTETTVEKLFTRMPHDNHAIILITHGSTSETLPLYLGYGLEERQARYWNYLSESRSIDIDNARKKIVVNAKEMADSGAINLEDILSGGEMVE